MFGPEFSTNKCMGKTFNFVENLFEANIAYMANKNHFENRSFFPILILIFEVKRHVSKSAKSQSFRFASPKV